MKKSPLNIKKPLTEDQQADSERLRALWDAWQSCARAAGKKPMTQGEFGLRYEVGSQGMVWQYLHGRTPLNLKAVMAFAVAMDCTIEDISPALATMAKIVGDSVAGPVFSNKPAFFLTRPEPEPLRKMAHAEVRSRFRDALPEYLKSNVGFTSYEEGANSPIRFDYQSETLHAELILLKDRSVSRPTGNAVLHLAFETPAPEKCLIVITDETPKPLIAVYRKACKQFGVKVAYVKTIEEAAAVVADKEPPEDDYEDYEE